jgi:hypothetical protein
MLIAGALATCGWGGILVLILLNYAMLVFDRAPNSEEWSVRKGGMGGRD